MLVLVGERFLHAAVAVAAVDGANAVVVVVVVGASSAQWVTPLTAVQHAYQEPARQFIFSSTALHICPVTFTRWHHTGRVPKHNQQPHKSVGTLFSR